MTEFTVCTYALGKHCWVRLSAADADDALDQARSWRAGCDSLDRLKVRAGVVKIHTDVGHHNPDLPRGFRPTMPMHAWILDKAIETPHGVRKKFWCCCGAVLETEITHEPPGARDERRAEQQRRP